MSVFFSIRFPWPCPAKIRPPPPALTLPPAPTPKSSSLMSVFHRRDTRHSQKLHLLSILSHPRTLCDVSDSCVIYPAQDITVSLVQWMFVQRSTEKCIIPSVFPSPKFHYSFIAFLPLFFYFTQVDVTNILSSPSFTKQV